MSQAIIGVFNSDFDAQDAVDELISNGFERRNIRVDNKRDVTGSSEYVEKNEGGIAGFFKTLFGDQNEDAEKYTRVANDGAVITVYAETEEQADRAVDILDDQGAVDVDERATQYGYSPSSKTIDANVLSESSSSLHAGSTNTADPDDASVGTGNVIRDVPRTEEHSGPGVGSVPTSGKMSKSRIIEWKGEASARLREDRDNETKFW